MKFNFACKLISILAVFGIIFGTAGVYANWNYPNSPILPAQKELELTIGDYIKWEGSEDLPADVEGENHALLITTLIYGTESGGYDNGLNNPDSAINDYINERIKGSWIGGWEYDHFGSMAIVGGDEMTKLFEADTKGLSFIIQKPSDTKIYIYSTSVYLGTHGELNWLNQRTKDGVPSIPLGKYIYPVYRTELTRPNKNSDWSTVESVLGRAKSDWYDESRSSENLTQIPSFDIYTWEPTTTMGTAMTENDAIWTFEGDTPMTNVTAKTTPTYYQIAPKSNGKITIEANTNSAVMRVYNSNGVLLAESGSGSASANSSVSFNATASTRYYVSVLGDYQITLNIKKT